ncbi:CYTH domain-containing protein [Desulfovibrio cuneatus]|uniref:CYTH domain-containing protein n=1 Tax=Desulfovibrio cuneatus TaxID=159728 RepID=UPI0003FEFD26|nr:CYTH domain-containing protein [Desulfovibrio cuneatus]
MATEIERKFLVTGNAWRKEGEGILLRQGYLNSARECTVRVRTAGEQAFLTIKGATVGITRAEYEYAIPVADANAMLDTLARKPLIEKIRTIIPVGSVVWEVDEFLGENKGLIVAEIELEREDAPFPKPEWLGEEVTGDPRYYNSSLVALPFSQWGKKTGS